jgi:hypothetical protein
VLRALSLTRRGSEREETFAGEGDASSQPADNADLCALLYRKA